MFFFFHLALERCSIFFLTYIIYEKKSAIILSVRYPHVINLFPTTTPPSVLDCFFMLGFQYFNYAMHECDFLGIYSAWSSLKFLDVWLDVSHQFMKTIYHCLFEYFLCLVLSSPFVTKITHMFKYLILSNDKSWILCFIFFTLPPILFQIESFLFGCTQFTDSFFFHVQSANLSNEFSSPHIYFSFTAFFFFLIDFFSCC